MRTEHEGDAPLYLGVQPSDRYAKTRRALWICGLSVSEGRACARFWRWRWQPVDEPLDVSALLPELKAARVTLVAGPQGLARAGQGQRRSETLTSSSGPSPDALPAPGKPRAGFLRSSVELFAAFYAAGLRVSPNGLRFGISETYPSAVWSQYEGLPRKNSKAGVAARRVLLGAFGLELDEELKLGHEQCDAALAAITAAAADGAIRGMHVAARGDLVSRGADGLLREGPIVELKLNGWRAEDSRVALDASLGRVAPVAPSTVSRPKEAPLPAVAEVETAKPVPPVTPTPPVAPAPVRAALPKPGPKRKGGIDAAAPDSFEPHGDEAVGARAEELLEILVARARRGRPALVTYRTAWLLLFPPGRDPQPFSPTSVHEVLRAAVHTPKRALDEPAPVGATSGNQAHVILEVGLDTFVVDSVRERPGEGHWAKAAYSREDWIARFGTAEILGERSIRLGRK